MALAFPKGKRKFDPLAEEAPSRQTLKVAQAAKPDGMALKPEDWRIAGFESRRDHQQAKAAQEAAFFGSMYLTSPRRGSTLAG